MRGNNPIRPPVVGDGTTLFVHEIFSTIQGEGPNAGLPAIFIRLSGCNLACSFCDTDFEIFTEMKVDAIVSNVENIASVSRYIVITGGEPLRQPIEYLCQNLIDKDYTVQVETNGTIYRNLPNNTQIICSPKYGQNGYIKIHGDLLPRISAMKFLISKSLSEYSRVPDLGQVGHNIPVFLQPMDEYDVIKNKENEQYAVAMAIKMGYRISLQIHKILNIP